MIKIRLTESELQRIITEGVRAVLNESQESKSISAAKKLVVRRGFRDNESDADYFVRVTLRNTFPSLRTQNGGKFILGVTRMYLDGDLYNANIIANLNDTLKLIASDAHINEYDRNLNGESADDIINRFEGSIRGNVEALRKKLDSKVFEGGSDYDIVRIDSFKQASQYGKYTSWCVTHSSDMFDTYTCCGVNQFYFCLRKGFEHEKMKINDGCPLDLYGLSMIAVLVNERGALVHCTCRWNHDNGGNDNIMDADEVSDVINMNFFNVFKPNAKFDDAVAEAMEKMKNGRRLDEIFEYVWPADGDETCFVVELMGKLNYVNVDYRILCREWFDSARCFFDGAARVRYRNKWNYVRLEDGSYLCDTWFDYCEDFDDGSARVTLKRKSNLLSIDGELLCGEWYHSIGDFQYNFAIVSRYDKNGYSYNYIDRSGEIISDAWFMDAENFIYEYARVSFDREKYNLIDTNGNLICEQGFDAIDYFRDRCTVTRVTNNGLVNFINKEGRLISEQWFKDADNFDGKITKVYNSDGQCNLLSDDGTLLCGQWFDSIYPFYDGFATVRLGDSYEDRKFNEIGLDGKLLCSQWFDMCYGFANGFCVVVANGKFNFIDTNGNLISKVWLDHADSFNRQGYAPVYYKGEAYKINGKGKLLKW